MTLLAASALTFFYSLHNSEENVLRVACLCAFLLGAFLVSAAEQARVFITDSKSWEIAGGVGGTSDGFGGATRGGARPQTAEIIKTFGERCPDVVVNNKPEKADYVVLLDHEGGKGWVRKDNKVAVFNWDGDSIVSHSTYSLGGSVKDACDAIRKHWTEHGAERASAAAQEATGSGGALKRATTPETGKTVVQVSSEPLGADIELDGHFVGNTPSALELGLGEHLITVKKSGYKDWERKVKISGGTINISAQMEKVGE